MIAAVAACGKYGAPVLPRGAGTSLAGQCCNVAVVLDFTKYMNQILEIDPDAEIRPRSARRGAGHPAQPRGKTPAHVWPDPSTPQSLHPGRHDWQQFLRHAFSARLAKPSTTSRSCAFCLYDGTQMTVGATTDGEFDASSCRAGVAAKSMRGCARSAIDTRALIRAEIPTNSPARFRLQPG